MQNMYLPVGFLSGLPGGAEGKASARNAGDLGSIPGSGRSPGEGNGNPLQYSFLENPMEGGAWWATVLKVAKSRTQLSDLKQQLISPHILTLIKNIPSLRVCICMSACVFSQLCIPRLRLVFKTW